MWTFYYICLQYKFTAKEYDPETGLYYFGARYYDARLSRWVSADPALQAGRYFPKPYDFDTEHDYYWYLEQDTSKKLPGIGGVFNAVNMDVYHYGGNNPVRMKDYDGLWTLQIGFQGLGGAGLGGTSGVGVVIGYSNENGFQYGTYEYIGIGGYSGISGSGAIEGIWSSNKNIKDLAGVTANVGGSIDVGISVGVESNIPTDAKIGKSYSGSIGIGAGPVPVEQHGLIGKTFVQDLSKTDSKTKSKPKKLKDTYISPLARGGGSE